MVCEICNGQGYKKIIDSNGFEEYAICDCHKSVIDRRILLIKLNEASIPKHFWEYELPWYEDTFKNGAICPDRDKLVSLIKKPEGFLALKQSLWLFGNTTAYKTSLAIQLGKQLVLTHKVKFIPFRKLMEIFLDFDNKQSAKDTLHSFLSANVIIIDDMFDLSRATGKSYQAITLYGFIQDCINANVLFICTSNRNLDTYMGDTLFGQTASLLYHESSQLNITGG